MSIEPLLKVEGIHVAYGDSTVIKDLSLEVGENQIVALMGLNGMGKTTLMKTLIGLLSVRRGRILVRGVDVTKMAPFSRVAQGLAYVPQGRMVFPTLTVEENIVTGLRPGARGVPEDLYDMFPVLKEMRSRRAGNLSGGQQQQLVIARALASHPKLLLLDEPTEGIQPSIIKELAVTLRKIRDARGLTIVVSEQVVSFALAVADHMMVLNRGRLVQERAREELDATELKQFLSL